MNVTKIEWVRGADGKPGYTWNPISGCKNDCPYCYARDLYNRFGWSFEPQFHPDRLEGPFKVQEPAKIFMGSVTDPCAPWILGTDWMDQVFEVIRANPRHTFMTLTKFPENLAKFKFPPNVWVGITIDNQARADGIEHLLEVPNVRFISFEPLLEPIRIFLSSVDWIIIGGCTGRNKFTPPKEWVEALIAEAQRWGVPVFLKDNLGYPQVIQEYPVAHFMVCNSCQRFYDCHWLQSRQMRCGMARSRMGLDPFLKVC